MSTDNYYNPDDVLIIQSPQLYAVIPKYRHEDTPPRSYSKSHHLHPSSLRSSTGGTFMVERDGGPRQDLSIEAKRHHLEPVGSEVPSGYSRPSPGMLPLDISSRQNSHWPPLCEGSEGTSSEYQSTSPSNTAKTPSSKLPYNPSTTTVAGDNCNRHHQDSIDTPSSTPSPHTQLPIRVLEPNGSVAMKRFECIYPGCSVESFQTQDLLNSHMNVHSNDHRYFCIMLDCPRGPRGEGFKRKSEMIRHGFVHDSPGYVCPFCPDQKRKYPQPDSLRRHARKHHEDKERNDPMLLRVLAQRLEGGNRRRKRRVG